MAVVPLALIPADLMTNLGGLLSGLGLVVFGMAALAVYFLPTIVAARRGLMGKDALVVVGLNIFLAPGVFPWFVALYIALRSPSVVTEPASVEPSGVRSAGC